jgi:hypothetical protein
MFTIVWQIFQHLATIQTLPHDWLGRFEQHCRMLTFAKLLKQGFDDRLEINSSNYLLSISRSEYNKHSGP